MPAEIPLAVSPSVRSPGFYMSINLLGGTTSPGTGSRKILLIASKGSAGSITENTQLVESVAGPDAVATYLGPGVYGHLAAKVLFTEYGLADVDLVAPPPGAGSATGTFTFAAGPPTENKTVEAWCAGRYVTMTWAAGETDIQGAAKLVAAFNALGNDLPVTFANGGTAVATGTSKVAGNVGNDIRIRVRVTGSGVGTVTASGTNFAGGTTDPTLTTVLALVANREYAYILYCSSNADAALASATSGVGRIKTHIKLYNSGANARLQGVIVGMNGVLASAKTGTGQHDFEWGQYVLAQNCESLPCEWGAAECGQRLRERRINPNNNRIKLPYKATLFRAATPVTDDLTEAQYEDGVQNGITCVSWDATGTARPERPVTTYFKDATTSAADDRCVDVTIPDSVAEYAIDMRSFVPQTFPRAKVISDQPNGTVIAPGVIEIREIREAIKGRTLGVWADTLGVIRRDKFMAADADGTFVVRVDPVDDTQVDYVVPLTCIAILAKHSFVIKHVST